jgi:hypothetical protein
MALDTDVVMLSVIKLSVIMLNVVAPAENGLPLVLAYLCFVLFKDEL